MPDENVGYLIDYRMKSGRGAWDRKKNLLRSVQQDAELKDRVPKKQDSPIENRMSGNRTREWGRYCLISHLERARSKWPRHLTILWQVLSNAPIVLRRHLSLTNRHVISLQRWQYEIFYNYIPQSSTNSTHGFKAVLLEYCSAVLLWAVFTSLKQYNTAQSSIAGHPSYVW